ncbi:aldo/keto reductase [Colwellia asteriadis]|uniref:Aldo/keto reductase n=1 Tax=Colwellia asteriadis TaxID=517723 RepID=A0ABN1L5X1_9GAMM
MKIALGSVQFGCNYGISNQLGQVSHTEIGNILALAKQHNITVIDTAPAYGNSEKVLGLQKQSKSFSFVTKVPPQLSISKLVASCQNSLKDLDTQKLSGLMLHHGEALLGGEGNKIYQQLQLAKKKGLTEKIGCSVYSAKQAIEISNKFDIDIIQLPGNIFDQEILGEVVGKTLKEKNIEIHVRSLFLQGVVFLQPNTLPEHLKILAPKLAKLKQVSVEKNKSMISLTLSPFIKSKYIDKLVIGCCSSLELKEIIQGYHSAIDLDWGYDSFAVTDEKIIKPSLWS